MKAVPPKITLKARRIPFSVIPENRSTIANTARSNCMENGIGKGWRRNISVHDSQEIEHQRYE
jgi:hypothetical protein